MAVTSRALAPMRQSPPRSSSGRTIESQIPAAGRFSAASEEGRDGAGGVRMRLVVTGWSEAEVQSAASDPATSSRLAYALKDDVASLCEAAGASGSDGIRAAGVSAPSVTSAPSSAAGTSPSVQIELSLCHVPNAAQAERALVAALYRRAAAAGTADSSALPLPATTSLFRRCIRADGAAAEIDTCRSLVRCESASPSSLAHPVAVAADVPPAVVEAGLYQGWFEHPAMGPVRVALTVEVGPSGRGTWTAVVGGGVPPQTEPISVTVTPGSSSHQVVLREDGGVTELRGCLTHTGMEGDVSQQGVGGGRFVLSKICPAAPPPPPARLTSPRSLSASSVLTQQPPPAAAPDGLHSPQEGRWEGWGTESLRQRVDRQQEGIDELRRIVQLQEELLRHGCSGRDLVLPAVSEAGALRRQLAQLRADEQELEKERDRLTDALVLEKEEEQKAQRLASAAAQSLGVSVDLCSGAGATSSRCHVLHMAQPPPRPDTVGARDSSDSPGGVDFAAKIAELGRLRHKAKRLEQQQRHGTVRRPTFRKGTT